MEGRSFLIVPEVVSPCQLDPVRFTPVQAWRSFRVTGSAYGSCLFFRFAPEEGFPVGSYKSSGFGAGSKGVVAVSATLLVHPLSEPVDSSGDGGAREGDVPCDGTRSEVVARRAGGNRVLAASRTLSTGDLRKAAEMISFSCVRVGR